MEVTCKKQVILYFVSRTHSHLEEPSQFGISASSVPLRDVSRNRRCCPPKLTG